MGHMPWMQFFYFFSQMLLNKGAQVDEPDDFGDQPIHSAAKSGCIGCVGLLYEWGAKVCTLG